MVTQGTAGGGGTLEGEASTPARAVPVWSEVDGYCVRETSGLVAAWIWGGQGVGLRGQLVLRPGWEQSWGQVPFGLLGGLLSLSPSHLPSCLLG